MGASNIVDTSCVSFIDDRGRMCSGVSDWMGWMRKGRQGAVKKTRSS